MHSLALLLKSYAPDFSYAEQLVSSFHRFNTDALPLYIVVPAQDLSLFQSLVADNIMLLDESLFAEHLTSNEVHGLRPGYINQEIVKLAFWELALAQNYFCVDSEAQFIRPFSADDLLAEDGVPYTVLVEDLELSVEPRYYQQYWVQRQASLRLIQEQVGLVDQRVRTCHGHQVFSATVLRSFRDDFLAPRGMDYVDALAIAPYEFSWYNMWLQKTAIIPIHAVEPFVKVFHHEDQHLEYLTRGITVADIARGYLAVVFNSSYARDMGPMDPNASKLQGLAPYLSYGELLGLAGAKFSETWNRRRRGLAK